MSDNQAHFEIKQASERQFGLVFGFFFLCLALYFAFLESSLFWKFGIVSILFFVVAFCTPKVLAPLNKVWMKIGMILGGIVSPIVMSLIFYCVLMPIGLCLRVTGVDSLNLKDSSSKDTYWVKKEKNSQSSMKDQF